MPNDIPRKFAQTTLATIGARVRVEYFAPHHTEPQVYEGIVVELHDNRIVLQRDDESYRALRYDRMVDIERVE